MIKIAVCDDDLLCLNEVKGFVNTWATERNLSVAVFGFDNGGAMIDHHRRNAADIVLLDIMMPLLNGMETAKEIRKCDAAVRMVFLTSSPEFAVESYDVKASGYILKPIQYDKLGSVLDDCIRSLEKEESDNILVKTILGYQKINTKNIGYIEAQNKKVIFNLTDGRSLEILDTLHHYAELLTFERGFFKCHRSYLVSISHIDRFNTSELVTERGVCIPIARGYSKEFKEAYFTYMFQQEKEMDG